MAATYRFPSEVRRRFRDLQRDRSSIVSGVMRPRTTLVQHALIVATAAFVASGLLQGSYEPGPVLAAATDLLAGNGAGSDRAVSKKTKAAVEAFASEVRGLSHQKALETAFRSYFAFKTQYPHRVTKPYLYFVDYGQPSTKKRGYVFDMQALAIVEGPFTVAHGRGSAESRNGVPTRFSNRPGSAATSLGLYLAQETYAFRGKAGGGRYRSVGLRLEGVSSGYNDNARARGVVAHGAPYVTPARAGRSEGCPAIEQTRAKRLLPKLAHGGMVFLFAPEKEWMSDDPWVVASVE
jgi:hypothetical protein